MSENGKVSPYPSDTEASPVQASVPDAVFVGMGSAEPAVSEAAKISATYDTVPITGAGFTVARNRIQRLPSKPLVTQPAQKDISAFAPATHASESRRTGGETAFALSNLGAFLQRELNSVLPESKSTREIVGLVGEIYSGKPHQGQYSQEYTKRHSEKKYSFDKNEGKKIAYKVSAPGPVETACTVLTAIAKEKDWGSDLSLSMLTIVDTLLTRYRLSGKPTEYLREMPDLNRELISVLESFTGITGKQRNLRRKVMDILDQLPISAPDAVSSLQAVQVDTHALTHPFAFRAAVLAQQSLPDSVWVREQRGLVSDLNSSFTGLSAQELFEQYDILSERAARVVLQPGTGVSITGKIGMEVECTTMQSEAKWRSADWPEGTDATGNQEFRKNYSALTYNIAYVSSILNLSHHMRDYGLHTSSVHIHLDRDTHAEKPDFGGLLAENKKENERNVGVYSSSRHHTWEVRGLFVPTVFERQRQIEPATIAHCINLFILKARHTNAQETDSAGLLSIPDSMNSVPLHQIVFAHILRQTSDPDTRLAALLALRHPNVLNSIDVRHVASSFDEASRRKVYRELFVSPIRHDQKIVCMKELFDDVTVVSETDVAWLRNILKQTLSDETSAVLEVCKNNATVRKALADDFIDFFRRSQSEYTVFEASLPKDTEKLTVLQRKQLGQSKKIYDSLKGVIGYLLIENHIPEDTIRDMILDPDISARAVDTMKWRKFSDGFIRGIIPELVNDNTIIRESAVDVLRHRTFSPGVLRAMIPYLNHERSRHAVLELCSSQKIPKALTGVFMRVTGEANNQEEQIFAVKALAQSELSDFQKVTLLSYVNNDAPELSYQVAKTLEKDMFSDRVFAAVVRTMDRWITGEGSALVRTFTELLSHKELPDAQVMELADLLRSGRPDYDRVVYAVCENQKSLSPLVQKHLAIIAPKVGFSTLPVITDLLVSRIRTEDAALPAVLERLIRSGSPDIMISILSSFAKIRKNYTEGVYQSMTELMSHPDLRVQYAVFEMLEQREYFRKYVSDEAIDALVNRCIESPEAYDESKLYTQSDVETDRADEAPGDGMPKPEPDERTKKELLRERIRWAQTDDALPWQDPDDIGRLVEREYEELSNPRAREDGSADNYWRKDFGINGPKPPSQDGVPDYVFKIPYHVNSSHVVTQAIRLLMKKSSCSSTIEESLVRLDHSPLGEMHRFQLYSILVRNPNISPVSVRSMIEYATNSPSAKDRIERIGLLCQIKRPDREFLKSIPSFLRNSPVHTRVQIMEYLARQQKLPASVVQVVERQLEHSEEKVRAIAGEILLQQPAVRPGIIRRLQKMCDGNLGKEHKFRIMEGFQSQHALPDDVLLWMMRDLDSWMPRLTVFWVSRVIEAQKTISPTVGNRVLKIIDNIRDSDDIETLFKVFRNHPNLPVSVKNTLANLVSDTFRPHKQRQYAFRILEEQHTVPQKLMPLLFELHNTFTGGDYKVKAATFGPMIQTPEMMARCMKPFIQGLSPVIFAQLSRFKTYPIDFYQYLLKESDTFQHETLEHFLKFLSSQRGLTDDMIEKVKKMPKLTTETELRYQRFIVWKHSSPLFRRAYAYREKSVRNSEMRKQGMRVK